MGVKEFLCMPWYLLAPVLVHSSLVHSHPHNCTHIPIQSPDDICDTLGLCNSTKVSIQSAGKANSLLCEVCDIVVYLVHNFAFTNKTEVYMYICI